MNERTTADGDPLEERGTADSAQDDTEEDDTGDDSEEGGAET